MKLVDPIGGIGKARTAPALLHLPFPLKHCWLFNVLKSNNLFTSIDYQNGHKKGTMMHQKIAFTYERNE